MLQCSSPRSSHRKRKPRPRRPICPALRACTAASKISMLASSLRSLTASTKTRACRTSGTTSSVIVSQAGCAAMTTISRSADLKKSIARALRLQLKCTRGTRTRRGRWPREVNARLQLMREKQSPESFSRARRTLALNTRPRSTKLSPCSTAPPIFGSITLPNQAPSPSVSPSPAPSTASSPQL